MKRLVDKKLKSVLGTIVTVLAFIYIGFTAFYLTGTSEGKAFITISTELQARGIITECVEVRLVQKVSKNVSIFRAVLSDGSRIRVTIAQTANGETVKMEPEI